MEAVAREFSEDHDAASRQLKDMMQEYLSIKKIERENAFAGLKPEIKKRLLALKKLQLESIKLEVQFHRDIFDLEQKSLTKHDEVFKKRSEIINGSYEPTADDCEVPGVEMPIGEPAEGVEKQQGIPNFWLTVLKNVNELGKIIREDDETVLKCLNDIRSFTLQSPEMSFQLEFHFDTNEFFQNSVLTKTYFMKCCPDDDDPFSFDGPEIYKTVGCEIIWNAGKNLVEKNEKGSFFSFFSPPELKTAPSADNQEIEIYLETDFEIGHYLKERVIPRAALFFTGEMDEDYSDDESLDLPDNYDDEIEEIAIAEAGDN